MIYSAGKLCLVLAAVMLCSAAIAAPVHAAGISKASIDDQPKKIVLTFELSDSFESEEVYEFIKNAIFIKVKGLSLTKAQKKATHLPGKGDTAQFYRNTIMRDMEGGGEIVIVLGKLCNPGDAQVVALDRKIVVEIVKPLWKLGEETEPEPDTMGGGSETPDNGSGGVETPADSAGDPEPEDQPQPDDAPADEPEPDDSGFIPDESHVAGKSYKSYDFSKIPVEQVQILGVPFDEALVQLVESAGFNVVVGEGIDETEVNLSFTQQQVSVKSALDLLCMAYDLVYEVEDDAIVIRRR